jgi:hypothetical protein
MAHVIGLLAGIGLIAVILFDAFETIIQPRRVTRRVRLTRLFFLTTWPLWRGTARRLSREVRLESSTGRDRWLGIYGPLALLLLLALWAAGLVIGFALVQWGLGSAMAGPGHHGFSTDLYYSGTTFFTLGLGDFAPVSPWSRFVTVAESATGFSFLALIIGYLPTIYSAFSAREAEVVLLDARAGSPPSALGLLQRLGSDVIADELDGFLRDWERWSGQVLESQLSYPVLAYFRSQHERQSWLSTLTMILDTCSLLLVGLDCETGRLPRRQARLTFAMARHAVGDLSQLFIAAPRMDAADRMPPDALRTLRARLAEAGFELREGSDADRALRELRDLYEPYVIALAEELVLSLPNWIVSADDVDDWATTAWQTDPRVALRAVDSAGGASRAAVAEQVIDQRVP